MKYQKPATPYILFLGIILLISFIDRSHGNKNTIALIAKKPTNELQLAQKTAPIVPELNAIQP